MTCVITNKVSRETEAWTHRECDIGNQVGDSLGVPISQRLSNIVS